MKRHDSAHSAKRYAHFLRGTDGNGWAILSRIREIQRGADPSPETASTHNEIMASDSHLPPGYQLREYRIERRLGRGGFGNTYSAIHEHLNRLVAIKEYAPNNHSARDASHRVAAATTEDEAVFEWGLDRFLKEGRALEKFDHVNIVSVHDLFRELGTAYIVMEHIDGEPLSEMLERQTTLSESQIREHVLPLTDGLAEVHAAGLLHRDIKPGNIMVRANGIPVLIDFGSARQAVNAKSRKLTAVVTDGYAPPEQYSEDPDSQTKATDIYALGAVLYRCVTGTTPRSAPARASDGRLITAVEAAENGYSEGLLTAINEALAIRTQDRPRDIAAFLKLVSLDAAEAIAAYLKLLDLERTEAKGALDRGDYEPVCNGFRALAELGFASAQHYLGIMYYHGRGIPQDRDQAVRWVTRAAERGHLMAQEALGHWYANGENVAHDRDQAVHWYTRAANQGSVSAKRKSEFLRMISRAEDGSGYAQNQLGEMYRDGKGTPRDAARAEEWFTRAAQQGHVGAQLSLGKLYCWGDKGVPEDRARGMKFIIESAESGHVQARFDLGQIYQGRLLRGNENEALALKWLVSAAESRNPVAQAHLGSSLYHGRGIPRDRTRGVEYLTKAAEQGDVGAQYELGEIYHGGIGMENGDAQAVRWFTKAAEQGHIEAQFKLGRFHYEGVDVPKDEVQAIKWFTLADEQGHDDACLILEYIAAEQGDAQRQYEMGRMFDVEMRDERNLNSFSGYKWYGIFDEVMTIQSCEVLSEMWYRRAAEQGHAKAQRELGLQYADGGEFVEKDLEEATKWLSRAAAGGDASALYHLGVMYLRGEAVPQDATQAIKGVTRRAGEQGDFSEDDAQLNMPLLLSLATFHVGAGTRTFPEFSQVMTTDLNSVSAGLGDKLRKYIRSQYECARHYPGNVYVGEMSSLEEIAEYEQSLSEPE